MKNQQSPAQVFSRNRGLVQPAFVAPLLISDRNYTDAGLTRLLRALGFLPRNPWERQYGKLTRELLKS